MVQNQIGAEQQYQLMQMMPPTGQLPLGYMPIPER